jgi:20S proteasome subunit beta 6
VPESFSCSFFFLAKTFDFFRTKIMIEDHSEYTTYYPKRLEGCSLTLPSRGPKQHQWSPYEDNGGTAAAIGGKGYVIIAGDTRLNGDFCINTRSDESKLFQLSSNTFLASTGMQADRLQLQQVLKFKLQWYEYNNGGKKAKTSAIAQLLSTLLYQRRFFPYYTFNIIAGFNDQGDGVCYGYDAVGCTEPLSYGTTGSASSFIEPLMDCLIRRLNLVGQAPATLTKDEALLMLKNAFTGAAERDIFTGDAVRFYIVTPAGVETEVLPLRRD